MRERTLAVVGAPPPLGIDRPERYVGIDDDWRTALETLHIPSEPLELLRSERAKSAGFQIDHVHQADEVHSVFVEAVPAGALRPLSETLQIAVAVVLEH